MSDENVNFNRRTFLKHSAGIAAAPLVQNPAMQALADIVGGENVATEIFSRFAKVTEETYFQAIHGWGRNAICLQEVIDYNNTHSDNVWDSTFEFTASNRCEAASPRQSAMVLQRQFPELKDLSPSDQHRAAEIIIGLKKAHIQEAGKSLGMHVIDDGVLDYHQAHAQLSGERRFNRLVRRHADYAEYLTNPPRGYASDELQQLQAGVLSDLEQSNYNFLHPDQWKKILQTDVTCELDDIDRSSRSDSSAHLDNDSRPFGGAVSYTKNVAIGVLTQENTEQSEQTPHDILLLPSATSKEGEDEHPQLEVDAKTAKHEEPFCGPPEPVNQRP